MRETVDKLAIPEALAALSEARGNMELALIIACDDKIALWRLKGSGIDREGGPRHAWKPERAPEPIVTSLEK